jgi:hypothetical protein
LLLFLVSALCPETSVEEIKMNHQEEEFFLKKFMELQQANAALYTILIDLYQLENVKETVDKKMPDDFLDFVKKNLV